MTGPNRELRNLHGEVAYMTGQLLLRAAAAGLDVMIFEGFRTTERQRALYAQGRDGMGGKIVTSANAGESWHNYGLAVDIVFRDHHGQPTWDRPVADWNALGEIGERVGLMWGGRWKRPDSPHFEWHPGYRRDSAPALANAMRNVWEAVRPCWS